MIIYKSLDENSLDYLNGELYCEECGCEDLEMLQEKHNEDDNSYTIVCYKHSEEIVF